MTDISREVIGWTAAIISFLAYFVYIIEFIGGWTKKNPLTAWMWKHCGLHGETTPRQASWIIWAALQVAIFLSSREQGATSATWIALGYLVGSSFTGILLFWYGDKKWKWYEFVCLVFAGISLTFLFYIHNPFWSLVIAIATDGIGGISTAIAVTKNPGGESKLGWTMFFIGALVNTLAIKAFTFEEAGFTMYLIIVIGYITVQSYRKKK